MKTKVIEVIEEWIKNKKENGKLEYHLDDEVFIIIIPDELAENLISSISKELKKVPHMMGYNMWGFESIVVFLNHPQLKLNPLNDLLTALENAEKSLVKN